MTLLPATAGAWSQTIVGALRREYPNALRHVLRSADDNPTPREAHPAFYGCLDWHSAVEMHWALLRLLPSLDGAHQDAALAVLDEHLTPGNIRAEVDYLHSAPGFERPYGWGWALMLADAAVGSPWAEAMRPLAETLTQGFLAWLPGQQRPNRQGTHGNTAFALRLAWPWAQRLREAGRPELTEQITGAARRWYGNDRDYPASWEPGSNDFVSPALAEAELMALVLPPESARIWLTIALPELDGGCPPGLFRPVLDVDETDGQGAHAHGLNLHRAAAFRLLQRRLGANVHWERAAQAHLAASLPAVSGRDWMVEHWLAAFAVLATEA